VRRGEEKHAMTEQQNEILDKLFPKGYVILAKMPNNGLHLRMHNPKGYESLAEAESVIDSMLIEASDGEWPRYTISKGGTT
jgi:hypothetical protein